VKAARATAQRVAIGCFIGLLIHIVGQEGREGAREQGPRDQGNKGTRDQGTKGARERALLDRYLSTVSQWLYREIDWLQGICFLLVARAYWDTGAVRRREFAYKLLNRIGLGDCKVSQHVFCGGADFSGQ